MYIQQTETTSGVKCLLTLLVRGQNQWKIISPRAENNGKKVAGHDERPNIF